MELFHLYNDCIDKYRNKQVGNIKIYNTYSASYISGKNNIYQ
jgi:hypothetical protein